MRARISNFFFFLFNIQKIKKVVENPYHYKPLKHDLAGERRIHIMKSFVLRYEIDEARKTVTFLFFSHHNEAYRR